jgi:predicted amidohydrolase YtcJ
MRDMFDPAFLDDPRLLDVLPAGLVDWYRTDDGQAFVEEIRRDFDGLDDATIHGAMGGGVEAASRMVAYLAANGGRLLFGSDTPSSPTYGNPPGLNGALEIDLLAVAGVSPRQILEAATRANAEAFGLADELGTIEAGKRANLLLLGADPLESADAWGTIETVVLNGAVLDRGSLSARR